MTPRAAGVGAGDRATAALRHAWPLLILLSLTAASVTLAQTADRATPISPGDAAPEIKLGDQHGRAFALGDLLKLRAFVVLAFSPKAFTSG